MNWGMQAVENLFGFEFSQPRFSHYTKFTQKSKLYVLANSGEQSIEAATKTFKSCKK